MAARKRARRRGKGVTFLILLLTSALIGVALWALRQQVAQQNQPARLGAPGPTASPQAGELIQPSERERLNALLRETEKQEKGGAPAN